MSLAVIYSRAGVGVSAPLVTIEVHLSNGLPGLSIVGLPEASVKESKDRVRAAIINSNFEFPLKRITINLAPADLPKEGGRFDLPIAVGILISSGQIVAETEQYELVGELALSGGLRQISGVLPVAMQAQQANRTLILPRENVAEAALVSVPGMLLAADDLNSVCQHLSGQVPITEFVEETRKSAEFSNNMQDVKGQFQAKRAIEIAAAGGHSVIMVGPPGTGKTMLASRLPGILPEMTDEEAAESAAILSISSLGFDQEKWRQRSFRTPHHTASGVALVGGGSNPRPGEISLAHNGVLFLDELPEFSRSVLEVLREPLESGRIVISRAAKQVEYPAKFQLVAAMNPCPCGYYGDKSGKCNCTADQVTRYKNKISGPLLDRIDMHIEVLPLENIKQLSSNDSEKSDSSEVIRLRVEVARNIQLERSNCCNAQLNTRDIDQYCKLDDASQKFLFDSIEKLNLSNRAYHRILKVARTIADLAGESSIKLPHLAEAINYRRLDRQKTG